MSNNGTLFCKSFCILFFRFKQALWYKQGKISILVPGILKHLVELSLHILPKRIAIRLNNHTTTHRTVICQSCLYNQVVVPLGIIFLHACNFLTHLFLFSLVVLVSVRHILFLSNLNIFFKTFATMYWLIVN